MINTPAEFFKVLYASKSSDSYILTWELSPNGKGGRSTWFDDIGKAAEYVEQRAPAKVNVYFQVGLGGADHGPNHRCSTKEEDERPVVGLPAVFAEIDIAGEVHKRIDLPKTLEEAMGLVKGNGFDPTLIVHTGNGIHVYWLFKDIWNLPTSEDRGQAVAFLKRLKLFLKQRAGEKGWHVDSVQDLVRVLRVPGTFNHKTNPPKEVKVIESNADKVYDPMALSGLLPEYDESYSASNQISPCAASDLILKSDASPPTELFTSLYNANPKFKETWDNNRPDIARNSDGDPGNGYDLSLAHFAVQAGWSDQQIADLIIAYRRKNNDKPEKALRLKYIRATILKARKPSIVGLPSEDALIVRDHLLAEITATIGATVKQIVKCDMDEPHYEMETSRGKVDFKTIGNVTSRKKFVDSMAKSDLNHYFNCTRAMHQKIMDIFFKVLVVKEISPESKTGTRLRRLLHEYIQEGGWSTDMDQNLQNRHPFQDAKDGHWRIHCDHFWEWLQRQPGAKEMFPRPDKALKDIGAESNQKYNYTETNGKRTSRSFWKLPDLSDTD